MRTGCLPQTEMRSKLSVDVLLLKVTVTGADGGKEDCRCWW